MASMSFLKVVLFSFFLFPSGLVLSKVEPPNYDFSLDQFTPFMPGKDLDKKYKKELTFNKHGFKTYKFYMAHIRYKFPVYIQTKNNIVTDFFAPVKAAELKRAL